MIPPMRLFTLALVVGWLAASSGIGAETHRFIPEKFYNTYSFAHPPALRIKSGDRVVTKTIDASGTDWNGKMVGSGPNPETGPFYVEDAEPGDMLAVTFDRIETNRAMAYSASLLAPYAVDPQAIAMDVEFTVHLVKKKPIGWPRLENETHIMVLASARPLLEAFQHATTELQRWLTADYGMTERGAQTFMGQATEYEIANVVDPNFTVVAKIRKATLPRR